MAYNEYAQNIIATVNTPSYCEMHVISSATTSISGAGTYYKVAGTTAIDATSGDFTMPVNNRITFGTAGTYLVITSLTANTTSGNVLAAFGLSLNTIVENSSIQNTTIGTASSSQAVSTSNFFTVIAGDYLEVILANNTNTQNITVSRMNLTILKVA